MQLEIRGRGMAITDVLHWHAEKRIRFALGRLDGYVRSVMLWLGNANGSQGGLQKRCRMAVLFRSGMAVVVEENHMDAYVALDRAADRAGAKVSRELKRQRDLRRTARRAEAAVASAA